MYLYGYICQSEGVHLWLAIEGKNIFIYYLIPNIYTYISEYYFQKSSYGLYEKSLFNISISHDKIFGKKVDLYYGKKFWGTC